VSSATNKLFLQRIAKNYIGWEKKYGAEEAAERAARVVPDNDWMRFLQIKYELVSTGNDDNNS
jgi:hypothetical protein